MPINNSRVWDVSTGTQMNTLIHHCEAVLHLRFQNGMMVTCSKVSHPSSFSQLPYLRLVRLLKEPSNLFLAQDRSIAVWDMVNPQEINLRRVLGLSTVSSCLTLFSLSIVDGVPSFSGPQGGRQRGRLRPDLHRLGQRRPHHQGTYVLAHSTSSRLAVG